MGTIALSYQNWVDLVATTVVADTQQPSLPASNVQTTFIYEEPWQPTSYNGQLDIDFGADMAVGFMLLAGLLIEQTDTIRIRGSSLSAGGSEKYDSGTVASGVVPAYDCWAKVLTADINWRYTRINISAPSQASLNYFRCGRVWLGPGIRPACNFSFGNTDGWFDSSRILTAPYSGSELVDDRPTRRIMTFSLDFLTDTEARDTFKELSRVAGVSQQIVVAPDPDSSTIAMEAMIGRIQQSSPITNPGFNINSKPFQVRQSL